MSSESDSEDFDLIDENIINILIASDINLGFEQSVQRDQEDDSFRTFEELLQYAKDFDVDAILLGGNLFYEAIPPLNVITRCISLLRKYCLSTKPVKIDCITDPEWIFGHCPHKVVNFKDPNLNIGIPIFSIYGHRDAPITGPIGPLDLLAASGLINYFGEWTSGSKISIPPLLLRKGITTLALYGLNYMNNEKLTKLINRDKFELLEDESIPDMCNVMILHQNRTRKDDSENIYISEEMLPDFLNLVIWGHEPVCCIEPKTVPDRTFRISQPGSTIATSLIEGEAVPKKVAILKIYKDTFAMKYLKLKTVRPFVYDHIDLQNYEGEIANFQRKAAPFGRIIFKTREQAIEEFIDHYIRNTLLPQVREQESGHPKQPKKPLLRLKVYVDQHFDQFKRLSSKYENKVANPRDMILFSIRSPELNNTETNNVDDDYEELSKIFLKNRTHNWTRTVEEGISEHFEKEENRRKLTVLTLDSLNKALIQFRNGDKRAFEREVREEMRREFIFRKNQYEINLENDIS